MCAWHVYIEEYLKLGKVLGKAGHANACLNTDIQFFLGLHTHFPIFIIYADVINDIFFSLALILVENSYSRIFYQVCSIF
jgi:hypothetical protein